MTYSKNFWRTFFPNIGNAPSPYGFPLPPFWNADVMTRGVAAVLQS